MNHRHVGHINKRGYDDIVLSGMGEFCLQRCNNGTGNAFPHTGLALGTHHPTDQLIRPLPFCANLIPALI